MRMVLLLCVAGCALQTSSSTSSRSGGGMGGGPTATGSPAGTGQNAPDLRGDTGVPSRDPPAGMSTMIALQPPPSRTSDGTVTPPGGPLSTAATDCSAARDHCLRGAYFAKGDKPGLVPVFLFEGTFYSWDGKPVKGVDYAYRSAPATPQNLATSRQVVVFYPTEDREVDAVPRNETEALVGGTWWDTSADKDDIDAAGGTFQNKNRGRTYKIATTRVLLEWIKNKPE